MAEKLLLYGASGHGKVVLDLLLTNQQAVACVFDDRPSVNVLYEVPVRGTDQLNKIQGNLLISIGDNASRKRIASKCIDKQFFTAVHSRAVVSVGANIGVGSVVMAGAVVNVQTTIGNHCIINSNAVVEHDCVLADFVHISPNAALAGNVSVGEGTQVGIGACVIQGIQIGKWAIIGAGAVIIKDVPDYAVVVGNPAKIIKFTKHEQ